MNFDSVLPSGGKIVERQAPQTTESDSTTAQHEITKGAEYERGFPVPQHRTEATPNSSGTHTPGKKLSLFQKRRMQQQQQLSQNDHDGKYSADSTATTSATATTTAAAESRQHNSTDHDSIHFPISESLRRNTHLRKEIDVDEIHASNAARVQQMSDEERQEMLSEITAQLGPDVVENLRMHILNRSAVSRKIVNISEQENHHRQGQSTAAAECVENSHESCGYSHRQKNYTSSVPTSSLGNIEHSFFRFPPNTANARADSDKPVGIEETSCKGSDGLIEEAEDEHGEIDISKLPKEEREKLEWTKDIDSAHNGTSNIENIPRFDLNGRLITSESNNSTMPIELFHHGDEPRKPGYTLEEVVYLAGSTALTQRGLALTALARILYNRRKAIIGHLLNSSTDPETEKYLMHLPVETGPIILASLLDLKEISDNSIRKSFTRKMAFALKANIFKPAINALAAAACCEDDQDMRFGWDDAKSACQQNLYSLFDTYMGYALPPPLVSPQATQANSVTDLTANEDAGISMSSFGSMFADDPFLALAKLPPLPFRRLLDRMSVCLSLYLRQGRKRQNQELDACAKSILRLITGLSSRSKQLAWTVFGHRLSVGSGSTMEKQPQGVFDSVKVMANELLDTLTVEGCSLTTIEYDVLSLCMNVFLSMMTVDTHLARELVAEPECLNNLRRIIGLTSVYCADDESTCLIHCFEKVMRLCRLEVMQGLDLNVWLYWIQDMQCRGYFSTVDLKNSAHCRIQFQFLLLGESLSLSVLSYLQNADVDTETKAGLLSDLSTILFPIQNICSEILNVAFKEGNGNAIGEHLLPLSSASLRVVDALGRLVKVSGVDLSLPSVDINCNAFSTVKQDPLIYIIEHDESCMNFRKFIIWCLQYGWKSNVMSRCLESFDHNIDIWFAEFLSSWMRILDYEKSWISILSRSTEYDCTRSPRDILCKLCKTCTESLRSISCNVYGTKTLDFGEVLHLMPMKVCYGESRRSLMTLSHISVRLLSTAWSPAALNASTWSPVLNCSMNAASAGIPSEEAIVSSLLKDFILSRVSLHLLPSIYVQQFEQSTDEPSNLALSLWKIVGSTSIGENMELVEDFFSPWKDLLESSYVGLCGSEKDINNSVSIFNSDFLSDFSHFQCCWPKNRWNKTAFQNKPADASSATNKGLRNLMGYASFNSKFDNECSGLPLSQEPLWVLWPLRLVIEEFRQKMPSDIQDLSDDACTSVGEVVLRHGIIASTCICGWVMCHTGTDSRQSLSSSSILETSAALGLLPFHEYDVRIASLMRLFALILHDVEGKSAPDIITETTPTESITSLQAGKQFNELLSVATGLSILWKEQGYVECNTELAIAWLFRSNLPEEIHRVISHSFLGDIGGIRFGGSLANLVSRSLGFPVAKWLPWKVHRLKRFELFEEAQKVLIQWSTGPDFRIFREYTDLNEMFFYSLLLAILVDSMFLTKESVPNWLKAQAVKAIVEKNSVTLFRDVLTIDLDNQKCMQVVNDLECCISVRSEPIEDRRELMEELLKAYFPGEENLCLAVDRLFQAL